MARPGTIRVLCVVLVEVSGSPTVVIVVVRTVVSSRCETAALPPLPHTRRSCADDRMCQGWRSHHVVTSKTPFTQAIGKSDTAEWGGLGKFQAGLPCSSFQLSPPSPLSDACRPVAGRLNAHPMTLRRLRAVGVWAATAPLPSRSATCIPTGSRSAPGVPKELFINVASGWPRLWSSALRHVRACYRPWGSDGRTPL